VIGRSDDNAFPYRRLQGPGSRRAFFMSGIDEERWRGGARLPRYPQFRATLPQF
jgi:hypothetical protein